MTEAMKTLARLKKASKLTRLAFHKNGPKALSAAKVRCSSSCLRTTALPSAIS